MLRSNHHFATGSGAGATEGRSRVSSMQAVPRVLKALRFDPSEVLAEVGVDARLFDDADNLIPDELVGPMLRHCSRAAGAGTSRCASAGTRDSPRSASSGRWPAHPPTSAPRFAC